MSLVDVRLAWGDLKDDLVGLEGRAKMQIARPGDRPIPRNTAMTIASVTLHSNPSTMNSTFSVRMKSDHGISGVTVKVSDFEEANDVYGKVLQAVEGMIDLRGSLRPEERKLEEPKAKPVIETPEGWGAFS